MAGPLNDPKHESFARFVASGKSKRDAAIEAGFEPKDASNRGYRLAKKAEISRRIDELQSKAAERVVEKTTQLIELDIASRQSRIAAQQRRWELLEQIRSERAADPTMQSIPGGKTGFMVRQYKSLPVKDKGSGVTRLQVVPEYVIDQVLLKEMRCHEQLAAIESGQWQKNDEEESSRPDQNFTIEIVEAMKPPAREDANSRSLANSDSSNPKLGSAASAVQ